MEYRVTMTDGTRRETVTVKIDDQGGDAENNVAAIAAARKAETFSEGTWTPERVEKV